MESAENIISRVLSHRDVPLKNLKCVNVSYMSLRIEDPVRGFYDEIVPNVKVEFRNE